MSDLFTSVYNPDVLTCLANLSNDEVFTPPDVANAMLDLLPQELFQSPDTRLLDPACKSGVFLREAAKRFIEGEKDIFPNLEERVEHIFKNQLYGIAITELTSLISRRSVYCSKYADSEYSVVRFENSEGNIRYKNIEHTWQNSKCAFCGASESEYGGAKREGMESHAYELIHIVKPEEILNMKFDVIIGNPPYQMSFGIEGGNSANAKSIYNLFITQAIKLNPQYLIMITPSRWMTKTAQGISESWVDSMISCNHFEIMHDFADAGDCFPGVSIMGGVNYFLWNKDYTGKCKYYYHYANNNGIKERYDYLDPTNSGVVIRDPKSYSILEKLIEVHGNYYESAENNFSGLISPKHYFDNSVALTSNWKDYKTQKDKVYNIKYYISKSFNKIPFGWIAFAQIPKNHQTIPLHKVYIPAANGSEQQILGYPFYGEPNSVCSQTYLVIGYDPKHNLTKEQCNNIISYIHTRFFRYLVSIKKLTQNGPRGVYQFVPLQDFFKPWTDEELYAK